MEVVEAVAEGGAVGVEVVPTQETMAGTGV